MGALWISEMLHSCLSNNANTEQKSQLNVCSLFGFDDFLPLVSHHVSERLDPSAAKFLSACLISSTFKFTLDLLLCNLVGNRSHQVVAHVFLNWDLLINITQFTMSSLGKKPTVYSLKYGHKWFKMQSHTSSTRLSKEKTEQQGRFCILWPKLGCFQTG